MNEAQTRFNKIDPKLLNVRAAIHRRKSRLSQIQG